MLDNDAIARIAYDAIVKALENYNSLTQNRTTALEYFYNEPRGDEAAGYSQVQSTDVSDMVEAILAQIGPILTNETLIQFKAAGEQDESQAQLESDFVAKIIAGHNDGYVQMLSAVKDSLIQKNGWIKVYVELTEGERTYNREGISEFQIQAEIDKSNNDMTISIEENEETREAFNVKFRETIHKRKLVVRSIAPEDIFYTLDHDSPIIDDINCIGEYKPMTRTELIEMGYSKKLVEDLPQIVNETRIDALKRDKNKIIDRDTKDKSMQMVETYVLQLKIDIEESGAAQLWNIHLGGDNIILDKEKAEWIEYATGTPFINPHKLEGQSIFDKLKQTQDSKTEFLRQWHDNAKAVNNATLAYDPEETSELDITQHRPGARGIRSTNPGNINPLVISDQGASILSALEYQDKQRGERGGAALDLSAADMQLAGQVGDMGAERQISKRESLSAAMTANLGNTLIRSVFLLVHKTLRLMPGKHTEKLHGKWVETEPSEWPERNDVKVMTGLSAGEKSARSFALEKQGNYQVSMFQLGQEGELVDKGGFYNTVTDWCRANNLETPEQYWIDPDSPEAQQAREDKQQQQEQQQQMLQQMQAQQQQMEELRMQLEKYQHDSQLILDWAKERLKSETEEAKILGAATTELNKQQAEFDRKADAAAGGNNGAG